MGAAPRRLSAGRSSRTAPPPEMVRAVCLDLLSASSGSWSHPLPQQSVVLLPAGLWTGHDAPWAGTWPVSMPSKPDEKVAKCQCLADFAPDARYPTPAHHPTVAL